ncbi:HD domain-containing protein [Streptomyces sp. NPDC054794]
MELRSVDELMDLLYACPHQHALRTAALLRRSRPADKELQVAGLVHDIGRMLRPGDEAGQVVRAAEAVRPLLGERVSRLVRHQRGPAGRADDDLVRLRQADEEGRSVGFDAGILEDWRTVLELVAARNSPLRAVD